MDKTLLWLWFAAKKGISEEKKRHVWEKIGNIERVFDEEEYSGMLWLGDKELAALRDKNLADAREISLKVKRLGARVITYDSDEYPELLRNITDPPFVLYAKGERIDFDDSLTIGVVGTRKYTEYGQMMTYEMCRELVTAGVIIVSGLARGIDSIAAATAVNVGGKTVGVLGCGLDVIYPKENGDLYKRVSENGVLITEYPPGAPAIGKHFPRRNRIIAGLSRGVVVAEAPQRSGALITASIAMENGRDVFAIPRDANHTYNGTNNLIRQGAKPVCCGNDVIEDYPYLLHKLVPLKEPKYRRGEAMRIIKPEENKLIKPPIVTKSVETLKTPPAVKSDRKKTASEKAAQKTSEPRKSVSNTNKLQAEKSAEMNKEQINEIYNKCDELQLCIAKAIGDGELQADEIVRRSALKASEVGTALVMMEMAGLIKRKPGNNYVLNLG